MTQPWQRQKNESSKSFAWFKIYRDLGARRTLEKVIDKITTDLTKSDNIEEIIPIPTLSQLTTQSSTWSWVERCRAYDNHQDEEHQIRRKEEYLVLEDDLIDAGKDLVEIVKESINDLKDNYDDSKAVSIANSLQSVASAYDKSVSNLRLLHGQSTSINDNNTKIEGSLEADIDVRLGSSQKIIMQKEYVELTQQLLESVNR